MTDWLIDWLIDWLDVCSSDWLIHWILVLVGHHSFYVVAGLTCHCILCFIFFLSFFSSFSFIENAAVLVVSTTHIYTHMYISVRRNSQGWVSEGVNLLCVFFPSSSVHGDDSPEQCGVWRSLWQHHRPAGQKRLPPQQCLPAEGQLNVCVFQWSVCVRWSLWQHHRPAGQKRLPPQQRIPAEGQLNVRVIQWSLHSCVCETIAVRDSIIVRWTEKASSPTTSTCWSVVHICHCSLFIHTHGGVPLMQKLRTPPGGSSGPVCATTSQPIYCQGGRKSARIVQLSPDALTSQFGWQLLPCNPPFRDSDSFSFKCHGRQLAPNRCNLGGGSVWDVVM